MFSTFFQSAQFGANIRRKEKDETQMPTDSEHNVKANHSSQTRWLFSFRPAAKHCPVGAADQKRGKPLWLDCGKLFHLS